MGLAVDATEVTIVCGHGCVCLWSSPMRLSTIGWGSKIRPSRGQSKYSFLLNYLCAFLPLPIDNSCPSSAHTKTLAPKESTALGGGGGGWSIASAVRKQVSRNEWGMRPQDLPIPTPTSPVMLCLLKSSQPSQRGL